ncbi:transcription elongation factor NusA-like protein [archaeon BMS3Abin16]|nr:transcription elongation factor NusA-like protein [archaeon BMS3Abin16]HDY74239.1 NusA-like transcription termination signal-binding factor [Euryarchaeota archaeon]
MPEITLTQNEIGLIARFQSITRATVRDCIIEGDEGVTFVVGSSDVGRAIGKKGANIKQASKVLKKEVHVVAYSEDPVKFIKNVMYPIKPKTINIEGKNSKTIAKVSVEARDRGSAIGSRGKNIHRLRNIVIRHHNIDDVTII